MYSFSSYKISIQTRFSMLLRKSSYKRHFETIGYAFKEKAGLEIGGPSKLFTTDFLPVYQWAKQVDGCNFSANTLWEGTIKNEEYAYFPGKQGHQFILDGTDLHEIKDAQYDFLLSCHNLEHIANPLLAIREWLRVLKPGGFIFMVLPDKRFTFDRHRPYTTIEHLVADYLANKKEDDLTHLSEILQLHDLTLDPYAGKDFNDFKKRSEENFTYRGLHHHVFSPDLLQKALAYFHVETVDQYFVPPFHQFILGQKFPL